MLRVAIVSPVPARIDQLPESGVAAYTAQLVSAISSDVDVSVFAQATASPRLLGSATVMPVWTPDRKLPRQVRRAVATVEADVLHVQHEFNLYGGLRQGVFLTAALISMRRKGIRIVTTIHGVVDPAEVTPAFLQRNSLPRSARVVRAAFRVAYRALAASSDILIVHHDHFREVLIEAYGVPEKQLLTIKPGANLAGPVERREVRQGQVLTLGFLTGYKLPEVVVEVAESATLPGTQFRFCVGQNPRILDRDYTARYANLERRVRALGDRAEWSGYIPDEELDAAFETAEVLVLPYTECVSTSAVAAAAQRSRTAICYSRALRPLFGIGPLEFELNAPALTGALSRALNGNSGTTTDQFIPWGEAAELTEAAWRRLAQG
jgi:glycosyltransferase involved in cell wall biosynthesis